MTFAIAGNSAGGYNLNKSLRFRSSASASLSRTPASSTNRKTWTWSCWAKRGKLGVYGALFGTNFYSNIFFALRFTDTDTLSIFEYDVGSSTTYFRLDTSQVFRDPSAWYHVVYAFDSTQATSTNRFKLYINGVQVTAFASTTYPSLNYDSLINSNLTGENIGLTTSNYFDGYMAEVNFVDGQALTPSSFGSTNTLTGVWQPAKYTGTYGTNGFYLPFTNTTSTTTLGNDFSGNGNNWTPNNFSLTAGSTYDSMTDVPTLTSPTVANYCVLSPLVLHSGTGSLVISNGNLRVGCSQSSMDNDLVTPFPMSTGKWYWEVTITNGGSFSSGNGLNIGLNKLDGSLTTYRWISSSGTPVSTTYGTGDVLGFAYDPVAGTIGYYKNNTLAGTSTSVPSGLAPTCYIWGSNASSVAVDFNFGQQPFAYTPPSGFVALNTYNLPNSTVVKGNTVMDATTYTGVGGTASFTNTAGFKPDLVWLKGRSNTGSHSLQDSVRGAGSATKLSSNSTNAENNSAGDATDPIYGYLSAFNSNGFTVVDGSTGGQTNKSGVTFVGWQWQAGQGTNTTNTSGSITSTVSVNPTAGFSIVTYTGNSTAGATIGHGLGVTPAFFIIKCRSRSGQDWKVWCNTFNSNSFLLLDSTAALNTGGTSFLNSTLPNSTVITLGTDSDVNFSGATYVAYCWAEIAGFSKFGSYTGNGSANGPFIYTGFKPAWIMVKCISDAGEKWYIGDDKRPTYNGTPGTTGSQGGLAANVSDAEFTNGWYQFYSNGFSMNYPGIDTNGSGRTYIYAAFAENPFKNALAR